MSLPYCTKPSISREKVLMSKRWPTFLAKISFDETGAAFLDLVTATSDDFDLEPIAKEGGEREGEMSEMSGRRKLRRRKT